MKNNRGSLTITALFTVLIFSLYGILLYARSASSYIRQTKSIETIQAIYAQDVPNAARIAEQLGATYTEILDENTIGTLVKNHTIGVGDFIIYNGDSSNSYTLLEKNTGYTSDSGKVLTPQSTTWRIWKIESNGDIVIIPVYGVNSFFLYGSVGYMNSLDIIDSICDLYTNISLGVKVTDIRSLTLEDIEDRRVSTDLITVRDSNNKYGKSNTFLNGDNGYTNINHKFYLEEDGKSIPYNKIARVPSPGKPIIITQTYYSTNSMTWNNLNNNKFKNETYGSLLLGGYSWLASPCCDIYSTHVNFNLGYAYSGSVSADYLCRSTGDEGARRHTVRPLVTINHTVCIDTNFSDRDGSSEAKAWILRNKQN